MLKKIISYFIIFSILYADADKAFCGNGQQKVALDPDDIPAFSTPRKPAPHTHSQPLGINDAKSDERTPLLGGSSAVSIPTLSASTIGSLSSVDLTGRGVLSSSSEKRRTASENQEEEDLTLPLGMNFEDVANEKTPSDPVLLTKERETDSEEGADESAEQTVVKPPLSKNAPSGEASDMEKSDLEGAGAQANQQSEDELGELSYDGKSWKILASLSHIKLIPDFYTKRSRNKEEKGTNRPNIVLSEKSPLLTTSDNKDLKQGKALIPSFLDKLSEKAKAQLIYITEQDLEEKTTCGQKVAITTGILVGAGVAAATFFIYGYNVLYDFEFDFIPDFGLYVFAYCFGTDTCIFTEINNSIASNFVVVSLFDAACRNATLWRKAVHKISEEGISKGRIVATTLASFLPSLLEPSYLVSALVWFSGANYALDIILDPTDPDRIILFSLCPFLFLDSMLANFDMGWELWDDLKQWAETSTSRLARFFADRILHLSNPSPEQVLRQDFHKHLGKITPRISKFSNAYLNEMYETAFHSTSAIQQALPNLEDEYFETAQSFLVLRYLLANGKELKEQKQALRTWYESITDTINYSFLLLGSPARLLALENVLETFMGFFVQSDLPSSLKGLSWGLAGIGFFLETALEYQGMKNFFQDFLWHKNPHGHGSNPCARITTKVFLVLQGLLFTLPLMLLSYDVCTDWCPKVNITSYDNDTDTWASQENTDYNWTWVALPFLFAEFANLTTQFYATYSRQMITGITDIHNRWTRKKIWNEGPRSDYKRDRLIRYVQQQQERIKTLHPDILYQLKYGLEAEQTENANKTEIGEEAESFDIGTDEGIIQ